ncbi:hypothetical protein GCM10028793_38290 [Nocardiopsis oceani]
MERRSRAKRSTATTLTRAAETATIKRQETGKTTRTCAEPAPQQGTTAPNNKPQPPSAPTHVETPQQQQAPHRRATPEHRCQPNRNKIISLYRALRSTREP